jgi:hypothetical protein
MRSCFAERLQSRTRKNAFAKAGPPHLHGPHLCSVSQKHAETLTLPCTLRRLSPLGSRESSGVGTPPLQVARGITLGRPTSSPPSSDSPTPRLSSGTSTVLPPPPSPLPPPHSLDPRSLSLPREAPDAHPCHVFQSNFPRCQSQSSPQQS